MSIKLTTEELDNLEFLITGGESNIYEYKDNIILKKFNINTNSNEKERKIDTFMQLKKIPHLVFPIDKVFCEDKFIGYIMEVIPDSESFSILTLTDRSTYLDFSCKDIVNILVETSKTFELIHNRGFIIGDVNDQNILISGREHYFIDIDSYGFKSIYEPDTYEESYTDPNAYGENYTVNQSFDTDKYAFAIIVFQVLTMMHPFGNDVNNKNDYKKLLKRMNNKKSVLGKHGINIPKKFPSWKWLSPDILNLFYEIFEKEKRVYLHNALVDLQTNLKFCNNHNDYYYGKYNKCPVCNSNAKIDYSKKKINILFRIKKYISVIIKKIKKRLSK